MLEVRLSSSMSPSLGLSGRSSLLITPGDSSPDTWYSCTYKMEDYCALFYLARIRRLKLNDGKHERIIINVNCTCDDADALSLSIGESQTHLVDCIKNSHSQSLHLSSDWYSHLSPSISTTHRKPLITKSYTSCSRCSEVSERSLTADTFLLDRTLSDLLMAGMFQARIQYWTEHYCIEKNYDI